jgi:hypothetical protein
MALTFALGIVDSGTVDSGTLAAGAPSKGLRRGSASAPQPGGNYQHNIARNFVRCNILLRRTENNFNSTAKLW